MPCIALSSRTKEVPLKLIKSEERLLFIPSFIED